MKILFLCYGNICRSYMAEIIARSLLEDQADLLIDKTLAVPAVSSAGTNARNGEPAMEHAIAALKVLGFDPDKYPQHSARKLDREMIRENDLIIGMTDSHTEKASQLLPGAVDKIFTLTEFPGRINHPHGISDPYGRDIATYLNSGQKIMELLELKLNRMLDLSPGS